MITRNPSLTDQVKAHLKERILDDGFVDGRIPPETELAADLGVSRTTVRDALSRLEHEGAIVRRQGAGTFVNDPGLQIKSRLEEIWSYEEVLRDHGYVPSVDVLSVETVPADAALAADLAIDEEAPLVVIEKLFLGKREPVVLTYNRIPADYLEGFDADADAGEAVYELLEAHGSRKLGYYLSEIVPVKLSGGTAAKLGVDRGTAAISFEEVGFDVDNAPVVKATSYFRDDLLRFRMIRRRAGA